MGRSPMDGFVPCDAVCASAAPGVSAAQIFTHCLVRVDSLTASQTLRIS